jgi:hypothetical protein
MTPPEPHKRPIGFVHSDQVSTSKPKAIKSAKAVGLKKAKK